MNLDKSQSEVNEEHNNEHRVAAFSVLEKTVHL